MYKICSVKNILNLYLFSNYPEVAGRFISSGCEMMQYEKRTTKVKPSEIIQSSWPILYRLYSTELATKVIASPFFRATIFLARNKHPLIFKFWLTQIAIVGILLVKIMEQKYNSIFNSK